MSCICLGQQSANIGSTWAETYKDGPAPVIVSPVKCSGALEFESQPKSFFTMPSPQSSTMERLIEAVFKTLEVQDNPSCVGVLIDATSGLGSSLGAALLNDLSDLLPGLSFNVGMVYNAEKDCLHGLGAYNSLLTTQSALQVADFIMYRGLSETISLGTDTLEDAAALLSTDLMLALHPSLVWNDHMGYHSNSLLASLPPALFSSKLIDVRSSLWKVRLNARSSRSSGPTIHDKYSPIRAMAVNLHAQYVQYNPENQQKEEVISHAYLHLASLPSTHYSFRGARSKGQKGSKAIASSSSSSKGVAVSKKDLHANLKWAMPSVQWADLHLPGEAAAVLSGPHGSNDKEGGDVEIATMCYNSPYAHRLLNQSLMSVEGLLSRSAYFHHLEEGGLGADDLQGCLETVRAHVH